jgi:hypothetical protein
MSAGDVGGSSDALAAALADPLGDGGNTASLEGVAVGACPFLAFACVAAIVPLTLGRGPRDVFGSSKPACIVNQTAPAPIARSITTYGQSARGFFFAGAVFFGINVSSVGRDVGDA